MATPIVDQTQSAQYVHGLALECVQEILDHAEKIFAVACGGRAWASLNENGTEAAIFRVIEDMNMSTDLTISLRDHINRLAALAGSTATAGDSSHA
jgi:hypothetical protein